MKLFGKIISKHSKRDLDSIDQTSSLPDQEENISQDSSGEEALSKDSNGEEAASKDSNGEEAASKDSNGKATDSGCSENTVTVHEKSDIQPVEGKDRDIQENQSDDSQGGEGQNTDSRDQDKQTDGGTGRMTNASPDPISPSQDTVWISPEQAAKVLSGDEPLNGNLLSKQPARAPETGKSPDSSLAESDSAVPGTDQDPDEASGLQEAGAKETPGENESVIDTDEKAEDDTIVYHRNRRKGRKNKTAGKIFFSVLVLLVIAYLGGRYFFQTHFFPNTYVDGTDLGLHSITKSKEIMSRRLEAETMQLYESDETEYIKGKDAGLHYVNFGKIEDILKKQDAANWFLLLGNHTDYGSLDVDVDTEKLSSKLDSLHCMSPDKPVKPKNAEIYYNPGKHKYMIKEETYGNIIDKESFLKGVSEAFIKRESSLSLQDQTYFVQADIKKDNEKIVAAKDKMNSWLKGIVKYQDGNLKLKLTKDEISSFISWSDDFKTSINNKKVKKYVKEKVAKTFNSLEGDIPKGLTAWKVSVKKETKALINNIKKGKKVTRTPVYANEGLSEDEYNLGNTYIDVNLTNQEMWYVENGKVVFNSDVVTGCVATGHATTTGIYHIAFKQRDHMMVKYHSFVHYWMPYNTTVGVGFHDANWRSSFGGEIYRYNGSHGCINMPPVKAEELFYMISSGTTVYVHD